MKNPRNYPDAIESEESETPFLDDEFERELEPVRVSEQRIESPFLQAELMAESRNDEDEAVVAWEDPNEEDKEQFYEGEFAEEAEEDIREEMIVAPENEELGVISWEQKLEGELINETPSIVGPEKFSEFVAPPPVSSAKSIKLSPAANHLYRIQKGDSLLGIAGTAYKKKAGSVRIQRAQLINRHPFNWRYHTPATKSFTKEYFPEGVISFSPRVSCVDTDFNIPWWEFPPKGKCYSLVGIPPETDVWLMPPPEVVQPIGLKCWAAAILSWSKVTPGAKKYTSLNDVIDTFRKLEVKFIYSGGRTELRSLVNKSDALARWPKESMVLELSSGKRVTVPAAQLTFESLATELGAKLIVKDVKLTLADLRDVLQESRGPVIVLKFNEGLGHGTVIFGVSISDGFIGEMDPFTRLEKPTGPAFGSLKTRWLPTLDGFKTDSRGRAWTEFAFLFKKKIKGTRLSREIDPEVENSRGETEIWNDEDEVKPEVATEVLTAFDDKGGVAEDAEDAEEGLAEPGTEEALESEVLDKVSEEAEELITSGKLLDRLDEKSLKEEYDDEAVQHEIQISSQPKAGMFYRIKKGENLLEVAGKAYQVGAGQKRLSFAKYINGHPFNHRYYVQGGKSFTKEHFPEGVISFRPTFNCDAANLFATKATLTGKCFAVIWIPNYSDNYHSFWVKV
ncbi:MAG: hypothetical protein IPM58_02855 [Nitrospira sp.]|nr:hypothetical protein [Nitrospira sp.]